MYLKYTILYMSYSFQCNLLNFPRNRKEEYPVAAPRVHLANVSSCHEQLNTLYKKKLVR